MRLLLTGITLCFSLIVSAGEGMWIPLFLGQLNEADMKAQGLKITAADIYSVNKGSLKDAIISFGGFCTGEIISNEGLVLTNHHCGFDVIQNQSSIENDYVTNGYWAYTKAQELPEAGLTATFIVSIHDVSSDCLNGVLDNMTEAERSAQINKNLESVSKGWKKEAWEEVVIRPFYYGNQYFLFVTETFRDVRMVGAPPASIGKFGADTDNWVWPRHTGDFALFRIYAGADNHPADKSDANKPYKPKHFLPISLDGVAENDFTMVMGFPGRTTAYLPSEAIAYTQKVGDPTRIRLRDKALNLINEAMLENPTTRLRYVAKQSSIANGWKKWKGEVKGLAKSNAVVERKKEEARFLANCDIYPQLKAKGYDTLVRSLNSLYDTQENILVAREFHNEIINLVELIKACNIFASAEKAFVEKGAAGWTARIKALDPTVKEFYKEFDSNLDQKVFESLFEDYFKNYGFVPPGLSVYQADIKAWANSLYKTSFLSQPEAVMLFLNAAPDAARAQLLSDPAYMVYEQMAQHFSTSVDKQYSAKIVAQLQPLQRRYMQAQLDIAALTGQKLFPDANGTLRLTYGKVNGYSPQDAVVYAPFSYLDGIIEKYQPGDYEFDVPTKLIDLHAEKNYGVYASENGKVPVCFLGSNHTSGGNSGSPALDAYGNLIGLNFDRVWEGTMSDINYDPAICRNVMVDARYVLFIIDKFANAQNIMDELRLVHPKTGAPEKAPASMAAPTQPAVPAPTPKKMKKAQQEAKF